MVDGVTRAAEVTITKPVFTPASNTALWMTGTELIGLLDESLGSAYLDATPLGRLASLTVVSAASAGANFVRLGAHYEEIRFGMASLIPHIAVDVAGTWWPSRASATGYWTRLTGRWPFSLAWPMDLRGAFSLGIAGLYQDPIEADLAEHPPDRPVVTVDGAFQIAL